MENKRITEEPSYNSRQPDNAAKKFYLKKYQLLDRRISRLFSERESWQKKSDGMRDFSSSSKDSLPFLREARAQVLAIENELSDEILRLTLLRQEIGRALDAVPDERMRDILCRRYIQGMKWEDIAEDMHLDLRWLMRLHGKALHALVLEPSLPVAI